MKYEEIVKELETLLAECEQYKDEYGERALKIIGDYPLYAGTSNITYGEAILIASIFGDIDRQTRGAELVGEYFDTLPKDEKGSWEDYEKWVEKKGERK